MTVGAGAYGLARVATDHLLYASKDLIEGDWLPTYGCTAGRELVADSSVIPVCRRTSAS